MLPVRIAAVALNLTPLDWDGNKANILGALDEARAAGATLVALPELCVSGYGCEDAFLSPDTPATAYAVLREILPATSGLVACLGLPVAYRTGVFNCVALAVDGALVGLVAKRHLPGDGIHYEPRWFKPWPAGTATVATMPDGAEVPLGDLLFDIGGVRIGFEICEDAWVATRPGAAMAARAVDIILNPSASHFAFDKTNTRRRFVLDGSRAFGATYVYSNLLGNESGRAIYDGGTLIATSGRLVAAGPRLSFADRSVTPGTVDVSATRATMAARVSFVPDTCPDGDDVVKVPFRWPDRAPPGATDEGEGLRASWETGGREKEEEFARAVALGLLDYVRKSRSDGFVVSLSGGVDSAACACLVGLMVRLGAAELGLPGLLARLASCSRGIERAEDARAATARLLTTVYQATANSGAVTRGAARAVAEAVGATHHEFEMEPLVRAYSELAEQALGRPLDWATDDIAMQNVQARVRSPGVWMLANLRGALLLSTSNRSEAAVGYATMDGDTSGGLAPISGIDKAFLRKWLVWMEREGPAGLGPTPELAAVNAQAPTAELRPAERHQTDEDDLMPYDVLDAIERAAIRDRRGPHDVLTVVRAAFPNHAEAILAAWVERFFRLFTHNQWKRERYAPGFHLDDENLDPKTWYRFPILSGGYRRELAEMMAAVGKRGGGAK